MVDLGVVMPVYKQNPDFLEAALHSILNQTFRNFLLVIVVDGAPDMQPLIEKIVNQDERVEIVSHDKNEGVACALNTGFQRIMKESQILYLTWVSSDNVYYSSFLELLRETLAGGSKELGLVYSSFQSIDNDSKPLNNEAQLASQRQYQAQSKETLLDTSIVGVSFMYKTTYASMIEGYHLPPVEDYDYWLRLTEHCEIKYIPLELCDYRVKSTFSVSSKLDTDSEHRKWRYAYHLARHQARTRRDIKPQVTVLYALTQSGEEARERIENLYEQTYSNYECYVLDRTPNQQAAGILSDISHPLTAFRWLPNLDETTALQVAVQMIQTPYTLIIGPVLFHTVLDIDVLMTLMNRVHPSAYSNFYNENHSDVMYRFPHLPPPKPNLYNELFRTHHLNQLLKNSF